jgi:hypothetical protein
VGWYSPLARLIRLGLPRPGGCLLLLASALSVLGMSVAVCLLTLAGAGLH